MTHVLIPWLRRSALAAAALALLAGVPLRSQAGTLVGVYEKSGFEYLVNLGDSTSLTSITFDANIPEFGGSTAGAKFAVVGVVDRNLTDTFGLSRGNILFSTLATPGTLNDSGIVSAQGLVAGFGTADSWFDLIPAIAAGAAGAHVTLSATAANSFETKVNDTFFGAFPFSTAGTIAGDGSLNIALYSALASSPFDGSPQTISQLLTLHVSSTGVSTVPEPTGLVLAGIALALTAALRRRAA